jgi:hypothetical protein
MLNEEQVRHLLDRCEQATGDLLHGIRSRLRDDGRVAAIWELLCLDALLDIAAVQYEPETIGPTRLDFRVQLPEESPIWVEAAWLEDRFSEHERRLDRLMVAVNRRARQLNVPPSRIEWRREGKRTDAGVEPTFPPEHRVSDFLRLPAVREFLDRARHSPMESFSCDLRSYGYTVILNHVPGEPGEFIRGSGFIGESPQTVGAHPVFRRLKAKGHKAKKAQISAPYVVILGGMNVRSLDSTHVSFRQGVEREYALAAAFRKYTTISAAVLVPVKASWSPGFQRYAEPIIYENPLAKHPLSRAARDRLMSVNWNAWNYGPTYDPRFDPRDPADQRSARGGSMTINHLREGAIEIEIPEHLLTQLLAGEIDAAGLFRRYGDDNPCKKMAEENRPIIGVSMVEGDPEKGEPHRVAIKFGKPVPSVFYHQRSVELSDER